MTACARRPLAFERNDGQTDPRVRFLARAAGGAAFVVDDGLVIAPRGEGRRPLRMAFDGRAARAVEGVERLDGVVNYLKGNDPAAWRTDVPVFAAAVGRDVWPGVDVVFHGDGRSLEYDFEVAPGVDPSVVSLRFEGADSVAVDAAGDLVVRSGAEEFRHFRPRVSERGDDGEREIAGAFVVRGEGRVGFEVTGRDPSRTLVIDPVVAFGTYLGGSDSESAFDMTVDAEGSTILTGSVASADFPTADPLPGAPGAGSADAFVTKINPSGAKFVYSTYLGGNGADTGWGVRVSSSGIYVGGSTASPDFPVVGAYQSTFGGGAIEGDAFVVKLNPSGSTILFSTFLGGATDDGCRALAVDAAGGCYLAGFTVSNDFPTTTGAQQRVRKGSSDAFAARIGAGGNTLTWSTYLGGNASPDVITGCAPDNAGNLLVAGYTGSSDFPIVNGLQQFFGGGSLDGFVAKIGTSGALVASTFLGGAFDDACRRLAVDAAGRPFVAGYTTSVNFPTKDAVQSSLRGGTGTGDCFLAGLDSTLSTFEFSTYFGGGEDEDAQGLAMAPDGSLYLAGNTTSGSLPTKDAPQPGFGGVRDGFVAKFERLGASLTWSTYVGLGGYEAATAVSSDSLGDAYVAVSVESDGFTTLCTAQPRYGGGERDVYVVKLTDDAAATPATPLAPAAVAVSPYRVSFTWQDPSRNECGFRVERRVGEGDFVPVATPDTNVTTYDDVDVVPDKAYAYRVIAVNSVGESAPSDEASVDVPGTLVLSQRKGALTETAVSRRDKIKLTSVMRFDFRSADHEIVPQHEDLEIRVVSAALPLVFSIPANDPGWKRHGRVLRWKTPRKVKPAYRVDFTPDALTPTISLTFSKLDFPLPSSGAVYLSLRCGNDAGHTLRSWTPIKKKPGRFKLP